MKHKFIERRANEGEGGRERGSEGEGKGEVDSTESKDEWIGLHMAASQRYWVKEEGWEGGSEKCNLAIGKHRERLLGRQGGGWRRCSRPF